MTLVAYIWLLPVIRQAQKANINTGIQSCNILQDHGRNPIQSNKMINR